METTPSRLVTRSDFDGLACAMMLKSLGLVNDIKFVHPKDVQDGKIELSKNDITTNLPYDPRVGLAFDHHESEIDRLKATETEGKLIIDPKARSAARVVYDYYGGKEKFPAISEELLTAVDKGDSADFTIDEILHPEGWVLLHYLMDPRTGLGRFRNFRISNYDLMMQLIDYCMNHSGNRFMIYALYPDTQISVHVAWGFQKQNTAVMIGKSIVNKASQVDIGNLCLQYGGGGHRNAGTCQLDNDTVDAQLPAIIEALNA